MMKVLHQYHLEYTVILILSVCAYYCLVGELVKVPWWAQFPARLVIFYYYVTPALIALRFSRSPLIFYRMIGRVFLYTMGVIVIMCELGCFFPNMPWNNIWPNKVLNPAHTFLITFYTLELFVFACYVFPISIGIRGIIMHHKREYPGYSIFTCYLCLLMSFMITIFPVYAFLSHLLNKK